MVNSRGGHICEFQRLSVRIRLFCKVSDTTLKELDDPRLNNDVLRRKNPKKRVTKNDLIPREVNLLSALKTFDSWHDTQSSIAMSTHF